MQTEVAGREKGTFCPSERCRELSRASILRAVSYRPMRRKVFTLAAGVSAVLCVGLCVLWVRSYFVVDAIDGTSAHGRIEPRTAVGRVVGVWNNAREVPNWIWRRDSFARTFADDNSDADTRGPLGFGYENHDFPDAAPGDAPQYERQLSIPLRAILAFAAAAGRRLGDLRTRTASASSEPAAAPPAATTSAPRPTAAPSAAPSPRRRGRGHEQALHARGAEPQFPAIRLEWARGPLLRSVRS